MILYLLLFQAVFFKNNEIDSLAMIDSLLKFDVVFVGEKHDSKRTHEIELWIFKELYKATKDVALSLEMFEKDAQEMLNRYLEGSISEEDFLKRTRPWSNYLTDYRPLVEYAKEHRIPVIAANIPRKLASIIARYGEDSLKALQSPFLPCKVFFDDSVYKERFYKMMKEIGHMKGKEDLIEDFYKAQCYKDATMADGIINFMEKNPSKMVVSINGNFHSDYFSGIPYQIKESKSDIKIAIITVKLKNSEGANDPSIADFVWIIDE